MGKEEYNKTYDVLLEKSGGKLALSIKEAAPLLDMSEWTLRQELKRKYGRPIQARRVSRNKIVIPVAELARWLCDTR